MPEGPTRTPSLWPREHGAYVPLAAPLAAALGATTPTLASAAIALGACLAFVASEPLRVVLGDRGRRQRELAGDRARAGSPGSAARRGSPVSPGSRSLRGRRPWSPACSRCRSRA